MKKNKKEKHKQWKQGWVALEEYRDEVQKCRDGIRKAKNIEGTELNKGCEK